MNRALLLRALLLSLLCSGGALAQSAECRSFSGARSTRGGGALTADLEFLPVSGAGAGAACDCATTYTSTTGLNPFSVAVANNEVWTANFGGNSVSRLNGLDGGLIATYAVGVNPHHVRFDGEYIWTANYGADTVSKLRADDGGTAGTYSVGAGCLPASTLADGDGGVWVACSNQSTIKRISSSTGAAIWTSTVGGNPIASYYDGVHVWVGNYASGTVSKLVAADGGLIGASTVGQYPYGIESTGGDIWVASIGGHSVSRLNRYDGGLVATYVVDGGPHSIATDGTDFFIAQSGASTVARLSGSTGAVMQTFPTGAFTHFVAFDRPNQNIWTANYLGDNATRIRYRAPPTGTRGEPLTYWTLPLPTLLSAESQRYCGGAAQTYCASPRVEAGATAKGVSVWPTRRNLLPDTGGTRTMVWSGGGNWQVGAAGASNPAVTPDAGRGPDGQPVSRIDFPEVSGAGFVSAVFPINTTVMAGSTAYSQSLWVMTPDGTYDAGTIYISATADTVTYYGTAACPHIKGTWQQCKAENFTLPAGSYRYFVGVDKRDVLQTSRPVQSVLLWGPQREAGATSSPFMPTRLDSDTYGTGTRGEEAVSLPVTLAGPNFSAAINYQTGTTLVTNATAFQVYVSATNQVNAYVSAAGKLVCDFVIGGATSSVTSAASIVANADNRVACLYGAAGRSACVGGTCTTTAGALTLFTGTATFYVGSRAIPGTEAGGTLSRGCYAQAVAQCLP